MSASDHPHVAVPTFGGYAYAPETIWGVGFWPRAGARLIDTMTIVLMRLGTGRLFGLMLVLAAGGRRHIPLQFIIKLRHPGFTGVLFGLMGFIAYYVVCDVIHGSTIGKRILGMVVLQEDGSPCRFKGAVIRELGYFVDALFFGIIGYVAMEGSPQEQRYGDEWGHTFVCARSSAPPDSLRAPGRFVLAVMFGLMADAACQLIGLLVMIA